MQTQASVRSDTAGTSPAASIFAEMYRFHAASMLKWARARSRDEGKAWDLVQDAFERALRARPSVTDQNDLRRWLFTVLRNRHYDHCRSVEARLMVDVDIEWVPMVQAENMPIWRRVELSQVRALFPSLSSPLRETLRLHMAGVPTAEIACRLLIRPSTVATRIFRARRKLQELITATLGLAEPEYHSAAPRPGGTRVTARGLADVATERGAERAGRTVADALGHLGDGEVVAAEQVAGDGHAPGEQVFHRRDADRAGEAFEERRA